MRIPLLGLRAPMDDELGELMARRYGQVNVEIWNDPDFRALPPAAQHLYLLLWTSPHLTFCGLHEWRPGRLTKLSHGFTEDHTKAVSAALQARHFLVVDEDTEEVLIRSWARFDELLKQPRLAVSYAAAYAATYSPMLRQVLVHETEKMRKLWPDLACWKDSRVTSILDHPSISAKDLPTPEDPFGDGFGDGFALGLPQTQGGVWPPVYPPPTPAPTPTPSKQSPAGRDERGEIDLAFDGFWEVYPRKVARGGARKAWTAAVKKRPGPAIASAAASFAHRMQNSDPKFIPHPGTWLNQERWADEATEPETDDQGRVKLPPLPSRSPWSQQ